MFAVQVPVSMVVNVSHQVQTKEFACVPLALEELSVNLVSQIKRKFPFIPFNSPLIRNCLTSYNTDADAVTTTVIATTGSHCGS